MADAEHLIADCATGRVAKRRPTAAERREAAERGRMAHAEGAQVDDDLEAIRAKAKTDAAFAALARRLGLL